jgi:hypothetical protein
MRIVRFSLIRYNPHHSSSVLSGVFTKQEEVASMQQMKETVIPRARFAWGRRATSCGTRRHPGRHQYAPLLQTTEPSASE